jgi:hypothetical protein
MYLITDGGEELSILVCGWRSSHLIFFRENDEVTYVPLKSWKFDGRPTRQAVDPGIIVRSNRKHHGFLDKYFFYGHPLLRYG